MSKKHWTYWNSSREFPRRAAEFLLGLVTPALPKTEATSHIWLVQIEMFCQCKIYTRLQRLIQDKNKSRQ